MQGEDFVLPGRDRVPSVFGATVLFFIAILGRELTHYVMAVLKLFLSLFVYNIPESFSGAAGSFVYYFCFVILPLSVYSGRHPGMGEYIRVRRIRSSVSLLCLLTAVPLVFLASYLGSFWCMFIEALGGCAEGLPDTVPQTAGQLLGRLLTDALLPAVCEELLFRGAILSAWEVKGSKKALVITSIAFMLMHGSVTGMPAELLGGFVMGIAVLSTDSLFSGMLIHGVYNAVVLVLRYAQSAEAADAAVEEMTYFESVGGTGGVIGLVIRTLIMAGIVVLLLRRIDARRGGRPFGLKAVEGAPRGVTETLALSCAVVAVLFMYGYDLVYVLGWVKP